MITTPIVHVRSERGIALVVVLLLMAVLSGLAVGFSMNGMVESSMAHNEVYYAGARAAAEAGMNRAIQAIRAETDINLLSGEDEAFDPANPAAAVNDDNGDIGFMLNGATPYALDANGEYSYEIQIFDDDDPALYDTPLSDDQKGLMGEMTTNSPDVDDNLRLILRAIGYGPSNTVVRLSRVITTQVFPIDASTVNPAILVDGDLAIDGNIDLKGLKGSVHANGDLTLSGNALHIEKDATASGDFTATDNALRNIGGAHGGNYGSVNIPTVTASQFLDIADYILHDNGTKTLADGTTACGATCNAWTWDGTTWKITGNSAPEGTFYVETSVEISGSPKDGGNPLNLSIIATGSIKITGSPKFAPDDVGNPQKIQFVTDGDLFIGGSSDLLNEKTEVEGQIFVREQIHMQGNPSFKGRIIVQDDANEFDDVTVNSIGGTPTVSYDGSLPGYEIPASTDYTYNVGGWIEQ